MKLKRVCVNCVFVVASTCTYMYIPKCLCHFLRGALCTGTCMYSSHGNDVECTLCDKFIRTCMYVHLHAHVCIVYKLLLLTLVQQPVWEKDCCLLIAPLHIKQHSMLLLPLSLLHCHPISFQFFCRAQTGMYEPCNYRHV